MKQRLKYMLILMGIFLFFGCGKAEKPSFTPDLPEALLLPAGYKEKDCVLPHGGIYAGNSYAAVIREGKFTYLDNSGNYMDFSEYECAAFAEDENMPGIITADGKFVSAYPMTIEEMEQSIQEAVQEAFEEGGNYGAANASRPDIMRQMEQLDDVKQIISFYPYWYVALKQDGTVVSGGIFTLIQQNAGWTDIVQIAAAEDTAVYGLKKDGTVCADFGESINRYEKKRQDAISGWSDLVSITGKWELFGLKKDGTVVTTSDFSECKQWTDIIDLAASHYAVVGLKKDGTVIAECENRSGFAAEDVAGWTDIVQIAVCDGYCIGLRADGTVLRTDEGQQKE